MSILADKPRLSDYATCQIGILHRADGSASWTTNSAQAVSSVTGPIEVRIRDELLGEATLEINVQPASGLASIKERHFEAIVREVLRPALLVGLHPRSLLQVTSQVVTGDDKQAVLECIINSVVLACVDAGFPMSSVVSASSITAEESRHLVCYSFPSESLVLLDSEGQFKKDQIPEILKRGKEECLRAYAYMAKQLHRMIDGSET